MVLNFGNELFGDNDKTQSADYKSAGSHQIETDKFLPHTEADAYETIHTVTAGKTWYVTTIIVTNNDGGNETLFFARGAAASEVNFLALETLDDTTQHHDFITPIKFSSGTRISIGCNPTTTTGITISMIGWEE